MLLSSAVNTERAYCWADTAHGQDRAVVDSQKVRLW